MRSAFESAWLAGRVATRSFPIPIFIDDISFLAPVEIGSVCRYRSRVLASNPADHSIIVHVSASVLDLAKNSHRVTNEFYFGFRCLSELKESAKPMEIPFVLPNSYEEMMGFLEAKRREKRMPKDESNSKSS